MYIICECEMSIHQWYTICVVEMKQEKKKNNTVGKKEIRKTQLLVNHARCVELNNWYGHEMKSHFYTVNSFSTRFNDEWTRTNNEKETAAATKQQKIVN